MKVPVRPPPLMPILQAALKGGPESPAAQAILLGKIGPAPDGKYRHWDRFRHITVDDGLTQEQRWVAVKMARRQLLQGAPLTDRIGSPFQYGLPPMALALLQQVDRNASGVIRAPEQVTNPLTQATYLLKSVVEEAITSSQLEGASTTRRVAKDMLLEGRAPRDRSEQMIHNNYEALQYVRRHRTARITPAHVMALQTLLTTNTLDVEDAAGRFRRTDEHIVVSDEAGTLLHDPPPSGELAGRLERLCDFANGGGTADFMHPVVRAILVHFGLTYDHPFVDGNGRTARALFYWVMAQQGYWLCEFVSISRLLKKAPGSYARAFLYTETDDNDATYFVLHQLRILNRAIDDLHSYLERKATEIRETDALIRESSMLRAELNDRQLDLMSHALKNPKALYSIESHRRAHDVAYATARSDLRSLAARGFLDERKRGRTYFYAPPAKLRSRIAPR